MGDVEFSLRGSKDPTTIWMATAYQPREEGDDRHHTETARTGPSQGGQGPATTPPHPGVQPQLGDPHKRRQGQLAPTLDLRRR